MLTRLDVATESMERMHSGANTVLLCDSVMAEGRITLFLAHLPTHEKLCTDAGNKELKVSGVQRQ